MSTPPMKMCGYVAPAPIANVHISRLWKLTRGKLLTLGLRIQVQQLHTEPPRRTNHSIETESVVDVTSPFHQLPAVKGLSLDSLVRLIS